MQRRLTTIMAADVVGFSKRVGAAEVATLEQLASLSELMDRRVERGGGRVFRCLSFWAATARARSSLGQISGRCKAVRR